MEMHVLYMTFPSCHVRPRSFGALQHVRFECSHCRGILEIVDCEPGEAVACGHCGSAVAVPENRLAAGAVVGDFVLREELGRGGMGTVYLAHQVSLDRDVAVKILHSQFAEDEHYVANFLREARAAAHLNHPSIVQAYAVGEDDGVHYLAMEYVEGSTLKQVLVHSGRMVPERALAIVTNVAEALEFGWSNQQLVHRDLKPDNIMLTSGGTVKLADLGLARLGSESGEASGEVHGTPQYISPEQLLGKRAQTGADIYSLGATFYHMLSGDFPYSGTSPVEIAGKHLTEPLRPLAEVAPDVPSPLAHVVEVMMAKRPAHRYRDAAELLEDLRRVGQGKAPVRQASPGAQVPIDLENAEDMEPGEAPVPSAKPPSGKKSFRLGGSQGSAGAESASVGMAGDVAEGGESSAPAQSPSAGKTSRKRAPLLLAMVLLLAVGGGAAYYFLVMKGGTPAMAESPDGATEEGGELAQIRQLQTDGAAATDVADKLTEYAQERDLGSLGDEFWELAGAMVEEDLVAARGAAKTAQLAVWQEEQEKLAAAAVKEREAAEKRARDQAEQAKRQEATRLAAERKAAEAAKVAAKQDELRWQAVELCRANDYDAAAGVFTAMVRSSGQPKAAEWAQSKQKCIAAAKKLYERVYNSKERFAGAKLPGPTPRSRWTVTFVGPKTIDAEMVIVRRVKGKRKEEKKQLLVKLADPNVERVIRYLLDHLAKADKSVSKEQLDREFGAFLVSRAKYLPYAKELLGKVSGVEALIAEIEILAAKAEK